MKELVSIIVPVYNVEKYIDKCLSSIVNQTYKNIEILVVNDGSNDNSDSIIRKYVAKDNRIKYIIKENGGLSSARNAALKEATGEYVLFVDSDDWLELCAIEKLYNRIKKDDSDVVVFNDKYIYEDGKIKSNTPVIHKDIVVDSRKAMSELLKGRMYKCHAQNKFSKLSIFKDNNIEYPIGMIYEDVYTTYNVFLYAKKISLCSEFLYFYLQNRSGSILDTKFNEKRMNIFNAMDKIYDDNRVKELNLKKEYQVFYITNLISLYNYLYPLYFNDKSEFIKYEKSIKKLIKKNIIRNYMFNCNLKLIEKIRFTLILNFPKLYSNLMEKMKG